MMRTIRFFRSAPVIPETQATGHSTQNSQVFKMLSAYTCGSLPNSKPLRRRRARAHLSGARLSTKRVDETRKPPRPNMWIAAVALSWRLTWHCSCARTACHWLGVRRSTMPLGHNKTGRKNPTMPCSKRARESAPQREKVYRLGCWSAPPPECAARPEASSTLCPRTRTFTGQQRRWESSRCCFALKALAQGSAETARRSARR